MCNNSEVQSHLIEHQNCHLNAGCCNVQVCVYFIIKPTMSCMSSSTERSFCQPPHRMWRCALLPLMTSDPPVPRVCSSIATFQLYSRWSTGKHRPSRRSCNWCFMWAFGADVLAAADQGLRAPRTQEQSFNCSSKQEVSAEKGCGGDAVQRVQLRRERETERRQRERERESK